MAAATASECAFNSSDSTQTVIRGQRIREPKVVYKEAQLNYKTAKLTDQIHSVDTIN